MEQHYAVPGSRLDQLEADKAMLLRKLQDVTRDRNEWRTQHENLLAMYQAANAELALLRNT